jgi:hypothetical protein
MDTIVAKGGLMDPAFCLILIINGIEPTISITANKIRKAEKICFISNAPKFAAKVSRVFR